jgi:hypothetical protein
MKKLILIIVGALLLASCKKETSFEQGSGNPGNGSGNGNGNGNGGNAGTGYYIRGKVAKLMEKLSTILIMPLVPGWIWVV